MMDNYIAIKRLWLLLAVFCFAFSAKAQTRNVLVQGTVKDYKVNKHPDVTDVIWAIYTDPAFSIPATQNEAELVTMGDGRENEIKVKWNAAGDYFLMVSMMGENGCLNRKAWPFTIKSPAKLIATAFCDNNEPWLRWEATAEGYNLETIHLRIFNSKQQLVFESEKAAISGTMPWPTTKSELNAFIPDEFKTIDITAYFMSIPGSESVTQHLDAPECNVSNVVAINDTVDIWHGETSEIKVLENDYDSGNNLDSTSVSIVTNVRNGALSFDLKTKTFQYTPTSCFWGVDSFQYIVANTTGIVSNIAQVIVNVEINPEIDSDKDSIPDINENIVGTNNLCDTDTDMDGIPNFLDDDDDDDKIPTISERGDLNNNGIPDYLEDWKSRALPDEATTSIEVPIWISVLKNDSTTMLPATLQIVLNPGKGQTNVDNNLGAINYYPDYDFMGQDSFIYVVCDAYNTCDTALVVVKVEDTLIYPEVFTPNNDGYNDRFIIAGLEKYANNYFMVYNRWGNVVFETSNYKNDWDGTSNSKYKIGGKPLPVGVYYYILKYANNRVKQGGLFLER